MRTLFSYLLLSLICFGAVAQTVHFENNMDDAIRISLKRNKPILVYVEPPRVPSNQLLHWWKDPEIVKLVGQNFVALKLEFLSQDFRELKKKYPFINKYPAYIFLHSNKELFFNDFGNSSAKPKYIKLINDAILASTQKKLTDFEQDYVFKPDTITLKAYITARQKQGITNNAALIETYTSMLRPADFNDYQTILFILKAGPFVDGKAYQLAYTNRKIVDSIYKFEPLQVRLDINKYILTNTMSNAQDTKNIAQAQAAANFLRRTTGSNHAAATKNYSGQMLNYYIAVNDTAKYLNSAVDYFDRYYMNLSADSIKRMEAIQTQAAIEKLKTFPTTSNLSKSQIDSLKMSGNVTVRRESYSTAVPSMRNSYANALNGAAFKFYETGTTNIQYLTKAMIWSRRSIELQADANYYDTLAHILFRLGYSAEAIKTQELAINKAKIDGRPYERMQEELRLFKQKKIN